MTADALNISLFTVCIVILHITNNLNSKSRRRSIFGQMRPFSFSLHGGVIGVT